MTKEMMSFHYHPLSYTKAESYPCGFCEEKGGLFMYCKKCTFYRHEKCWKESALFQSGQRPHRHDHILSLDHFKSHICCFCNESVGFGYDCNECSFFVHKRCIDSFNIELSLCKHSLKICVRDSLKYPQGQCHFCKENILGEFFFHCSICNISVDKKCMESPEKRPVTLHNPKNHEHRLTLLQRLVAFTCNGCGLQGDRNPYICLECDFMMHKDCVDLPRVISINRHDHRISRTSHLGYGDWECGVCRQKIDWVYGAFKCLRCDPGYAVHSKCATREDVWDGKELEDEPEEEEVEDPFEVISETEIIHFSHKEHHLKLYDEDYEVKDLDSIRCVCCVVPINVAPFFKCVECDFYLHKACASFPLRKGHFLHNHKLALHAAFSTQDGFKCSACHQFSTGFSYKCRETNQQAGCNTKVLDVRCVSISEPFHHELHEHPLYHISTKDAICRGCGTNSSYVLSCTKCDVSYNLCMKCATLPRKIKNRCYDSFLSLCHGAENASGELWCDICEMKTDPKVWYYTCEKGQLSLHVNCVLGDLFYIKPGKLGNERYNTVLNNGATRPVCSICEDRCRFPSLIMSEKGGKLIYMCSFGCGKN